MSTVKKSFFITLHGHQLWRNFLSWNEIANEESDSLYSQFLDGVKDNQNLEDLSFTITENSYLTDRFALLFIQCFTKLTSVYYCNYDPDLLFYQPDDLQSRSLVFQDIWKALEPSKSTLWDLEIDSPETTFPEKMSALETGFPRLSHLNFRSKIRYVTKLGAFWLGFPCVNSLQVSELTFPDEKRLEEFFDDMKEISEEKLIVFELNVEDITQTFFICSLVKFIEEANIKGRLSLHFKKVQVENSAGFGEVLNLALEKGCFERLQMDEKDSGLIFFIRSQKVIDLKDGLVLKPVNHEQTEL